MLEAKSPEAWGARGPILWVVLEEKFREIAGHLSIGGISEGEGDGWNLQAEGMVWAKVEGWEVNTKTCVGETKQLSLIAVM